MNKHLPFLVFAILVLLMLRVGAQPVGKDKTFRVKWRVKSGHPFIASPVISNGTTYVGGTDSVMYAIDRLGKILWTAKSGGPVRSAVAIMENTIYYSGGDGAVYSVDKTSGKRLWVFRSLGGILGERRYDPADYFDSAPTVFEGRVFVGSGDGRLYCLDARTGKLNWYFQAGDIIHTTPVVAGNKVLFGSSDGFLYALGLDGSLRWKFKSVGHKNFPRGEMQGSPVVAGNLVFIGSRDYNLYAVDLEGGYAHWNKQYPLGWATALTASDSVLFVGTSDDRLFLALDPSTGKEHWRFNAGFNVFGPGTVSESGVYFGTQMGKLFELDRRSGKLGRVIATDGYNQNRLDYFKPDDSFRDDLYSRITTFDRYVQMLYAIGAIYSTPAASGNLIVVSSTDGCVYGIEK